MFFSFCKTYLTDDTAHGEDRPTDDHAHRGTDAEVLPDPEEGTSTWKAVLLLTVARSNARTAVAVKSTLIRRQVLGCCV